MHGRRTKPGAEWPCIVQLSLCVVRAAVTVQRGHPRRDLKTLRELDGSSEPPQKPFDGSLKRFKILVYEGRSRTAKSLRARDFFGAAKTLVVNCAGITYPNLTGYVDQQCIVWDEAGFKFVLENRQLLQAGIEGSQIQQSPTQCSSRWIFVYGVAMLITTNSWIPSGATGPDAEWLEENCDVVEVKEKMYVE